MLLKNGEICDYRQYKKSDVRIRDGRICEIGQNLESLENEEVIDCANRVILPALIDMAYPKNKTLSLKTIQSLCEKALVGGVGSILLRPDTTPKIDSEAIIEFVNSMNQTLKSVNIIPCIAPLKDEALNNISMLVSSGARAIVTDGAMSGYMLYKISQYANMLDVPLVAIAQEMSLSEGVINEGELCFKLGLPGIPQIAQTIEVARFSELARFSGVRLSFDAISEGQSLGIISHFKKMGANITTQTPIHHLILSDEKCDGYDTSAKIFPPLKDKATQELLCQKLDSEIDMLTCLQSNTYRSLKDQVFESASFGINAIMFYFALGYEFLVKRNLIDLKRLSYLTSYAQARLFGLNKGEIDLQKDADLIIIDPNGTTQVSDAPNPYNGLTLQSRVVATVTQGRVHFVG